MTRPKRLSSKRGVDHLSTLKNVEFTRLFTRAARSLYIDSACFAAQNCLRMKVKPITFDSDFPAQSKTLLQGVTHSAHATGRLIVD